MKTATTNTVNCLCRERAKCKQRMPHGANLKAQESYLRRQNRPGMAGSYARSNIYSEGTNARDVRRLRAAADTDDHTSNTAFLCWLGSLCWGSSDFSRLLQERRSTSSDGGASSLSTRRRSRRRCNRVGRPWVGLRCVEVLHSSL
jgi:hypothetical protein